MEQSVRMTLPLPRNVANRPANNACNLGFAKCNYLLGTRKKVGAVALAQGQKPKHQTVGLPFKRAEIRAILYTGNTLDDDNLMARLKWPLENALVRAGILADDKRPSCRVLEPRQTIDRRHPRVEITVTEVV